MHLEESKGLKLLKILHSVPHFCNKIMHFVPHFYNMLFLRVETVTTALVRRAARFRPWVKVSLQ